MSDARGHVILVGLEGLSVRTLQELDRLGESVVLIAPPEGERRHRELAAGLAWRVIDGDPRDPSVLRAAGVAQARALVLSANDDVTNIHVALVAVEEAPGLHIVVRTFDEEFGRRVAALIPGARAMSASALAAPGFVSAILDTRDERVIEVAGRTFMITEADPADAGVAAVLVDDGSDPPVVVPDPSDVSPGRHPAMVALDPEEAADVRAARRRRRGIGSRRPGLRSSLARVDRRFWVLGAVLSVITVGAAMVFGVERHIAPVDALYATVAGFFGAVNPDVAVTPELKAFSIVLTLVGAAALALFYGLIADVVLAARMRDVLGPRAQDAHDHVVIVGLGTVGFRIAVALREAGVSVVAAEQDADGRFVDDARRLGIPVVVGDASNPGSLRSLGVDRARALAAVTDRDAANLAVALHARGLRTELRIVVRLFDADLAAQLGRALGAYHARSVSTLAAPAFAAAAIDGTVLATIPVGHQRVVVVARVAVAAGAEADGSTVAAEVAAARAMAGGGARVLGIARGSSVAWSPGPTSPIGAGDELLVVAPRRSLAVVLSRASAPDARPG